MDNLKIKSLFNKSELKKFILETAKTRKMCDGSPRFTRVSPAFTALLEYKLKELVRNHIHHQPSIGKTL